MQRWLDRRQSDSTAASHSTLFYRVKLFVEWCEDQGIDRIRDVSGWDIESYETHRRSQGVKMLTLNKNFGTLRQFLEYCARVDLVDDDLPEKVEPPKVSRDERSSDVQLASEDALPLLRHYRETPSKRADRGHALLEVAWHTGARLGALRALDLRDVDPDEAYVHYVHRPETETPLKNGTDGERYVSLPDEVADILAAYKREHRRDGTHDEYGREPFFTSREGRPSRAAIRGWLYLATVPCHYTDCPHSRSRPTCEYTGYTYASKCPSSRSPHQIRTGAISWMLDRGVPVEIVAERVNASVRVIEEHYDKTPGREAMERRRRQYTDRLDINEDDTQ